MSILQKVYIETTVWYQMANYAASGFKNSSEQLFQLIDQKHFSIFISNIVLEELTFNKPRYRAKVEQLLSHYKPVVLVQNNETEDLALAYLENAYKNDVREETIVDSFHAAISTAANISYIASYNYKNLLSVKKIEHINAMNVLAGYNHHLHILPPFMFLDLDDYLGETGTVDSYVWELKKKHGIRLNTILKTEAQKRRTYHENVAQKLASRIGLQTIYLSDVQVG